MEISIFSGIKSTIRTGAINHPKLVKLAKDPKQIDSKLNGTLAIQTNTDTKRKADILKNNAMNILSVDIDDGYFRSIDAVEDQVRVLGFGNYVIYTTASHNPDLQKYKYRIVVFLESPITCEQFTITQLALCSIFKSDDVMARIQQVLYLPAKVKGQADHYEFRSNSENLFSIESSKELTDTIIKCNTERLKKEKEAETVAKKATAEREARKASSIYSGSKLLSVFDLVEEQFSVEFLLEQYGFKKSGGRYLHPNSSSGLAGVILLDGKYYSHHSLASDPLADGYAHGCFDLIKEFEHNGNEADTIEDLEKKLTVNGGSLLDFNNQVKTSVLENEIEKNNREMHENLKAMKQQNILKAEAMADDYLFGDKHDKNEPDPFDEPIVLEEINKIEESTTTAITMLNKEAVEIDLSSDEIINFDYIHNIMPTKSFDFDLTKPSGIVERIINETCIRMHRRDPALAIGSALTLAMRAGLPTIENSRLNENYDIEDYGTGLNGFKIYLNILISGISASGKDKPQQLLNHALTYIGDDVYGRIASEKDLNMNLIDSMGSCCCVIDEAGYLFSAMRDSSADYLKSLRGNMMKLSTSNHHNFDGLTKRGVAGEYKRELNNHHVNMKNVDGEDEAKEIAIKAKIQNQIDNTQWKISACENGIPEPQFSLMASSTPTDLEGTITMDSINTGQLSRFLLFSGKSMVSPIRKIPAEINSSKFSDSLLADLYWIRSHAHNKGQYRLQKTTENLYNYISKWFESRRNHTKFSVMYRRGFEMTVQIASILSIQDRIVGEKSLIWAFCLVRMNIENFIMIATEEDQNTPFEIKIKIRMAKNVESSEKGIYKSKLISNLVKVKKLEPYIPFFDSYLQNLIDSGYVREEGKKLFHTGKKSIDEVS